MKYNPVPREHYHTDWVAARTIAYLDSLDPNDNWFVWMSFPDPHHPWDPPQDEARRINWRDLDLPPGYPGSREKIEKILSGKPRHWLDWYEGRFGNFEGGPAHVRPVQAHRGSDSRSQRVDPRRERTDRPGLRPRAGAYRRAWMGIAHRRILHHRSRRAARRLRPALQGPVSRRRADADSDDLAARAVGQRHAQRNRRAGRATRSRADVLPNRRHPGSRLDAGQAAADRAGLGPRARHHRVGQPVRRHRDASADDLSRRLHAHGV